MTEALVLGGGGVAGIAWITGLLTGLAETSLAAIGANLAGPSTRTPAAGGGLAQGRALQLDWSTA